MVSTKFPVHAIQLEKGRVYSSYKHPEFVFLFVGWMNRKHSDHGYFSYLDKNGMGNFYVTRKDLFIPES